MTRSIFLISIFCLVYSSSFAQNLVPNMSFETYTTCPGFASELDKAAPWFNPNSGTPELFHACASWGSYVSVPATATGGYQLARTGDGFAGMYVFRSDVANMREYIEVPLSSPLIAGECYYFEMHVNHPNDHELTCDGIGVRFSQGLLSPLTNGGLMGLPAHIENDPGTLLSDTLGWMTVFGDYVAQGGEDHLVIGNFKDDANTVWSVLQSNVWYTSSAYLYVDDVSLVATFMVVDLGPDTLLCDGNNILLNSGNPGADHLWSDGSTNETLLVSSSGEYWVEASYGTCSTSDTILIQFENIPIADLGVDKELCPEHEIILNSGVGLNDDILWNNGSTTPDITVTIAGEYWVQATNVCGSSSDSIMILNGECLDHVFIPNSFSPNGDGINDFFYPVYDSNVQEITLEIFDRWGSLVQTVSSEPWNGASNGKELPNGVYAWKMHSTLKGIEARIGHVTLIQ